MEPHLAEHEATLDLRQILQILRRYIVLILAVPTISALMSSSLVYFVIDPVYSAETTLLVKNQAPGQIAYNDILTSRQLVKTYRELARSRTVALDAIRDASLHISADKLRTMVNVTPIGDTEIIAIRVKHTDPTHAAELANAVASSFISNTLRIMQVENITVIDPAIAPEAPSQPRKALTIVVACFTGSLLGLTAAFVLAYLDNTITTPEDAQNHLGLAVLGAIPVFKRQDFVPEKEVSHEKQDEDIPTHHF